MKLTDFFSIIEANHTFQNPTSEAKLDQMISYCNVADGQRILDVGCGKAWLLRRLISRYAVQADGIEFIDSFADEADTLAAAQPSKGSLTITKADARTVSPKPAHYDLGLCIGASFAIGSFEEMLAWLRPQIRIGGMMAVGDIYARATPVPPESAKHFSGGAVRSLQDTAKMLDENGLRLVGLIDSSLDDWDRYESLHWHAADAWLQNNPDHPERNEFEALIEPFKRDHIHSDRESLGWSLFVCRVLA
ncbi:MAG: methyltransferase domain-containing protein [Pseudomonadaceae bacterium]|nr:methyltransferase domain-containing protein [Pseudomonadaceae bacterium]